MKIKTFWFNVLSSCVDNDMHLRKANMNEEFKNLYTPEKIDNEINLFCSNKDIIDIKVNEVYKSNTLNNGTNKVMLVYTILYKEVIL